MFTGKLSQGGKGGREGAVAHIVKPIDKHLLPSHIQNSMFGMKQVENKE